MKRSHFWYGLLVCVFLSVLLIAAFANEGVQINSLQHVNTQSLNLYIATMIKNREPEIKTAVVNGAEITDFKLNEATFDIISGKLTIYFTVQYKKSAITGKLGFEIRVSNDSSQKIGGYCLGLDGGLHSNKMLTDIALAFTSNHINKSLAGKVFWSDNLPHDSYKVFKNENLTGIVNQALITSGAADQQFSKISQSVQGGTLQLEFKNVICRSFDLSTGQAQINAGIGAILSPDLGPALNIPDAGSLEAYFDFYINPADQGWWARLNKFKLNIHIVTPELNAMAQEKIDRELNARQVLIPLDMPKAKPL